MPNCVATRRACRRSSNEQQRQLLRQSCIERPTISAPRSFNKTAAVDESTPPLMATAIIELKTSENFFYGIRSQDTAMNLRCGQSAKGFCNLISGDESRVGDIHSDEHLRCIGTRRDRGAASLCFEFCLLNTTVIDLHPQFHHVAAYRVGHFGNSVGVRDLTHTSRILKIIEQHFRI